MATSKKGAKASDETNDTTEELEQEEEETTPVEVKEEAPKEAEPAPGPRIPANVQLARSVALQRVIRTMRNGAASLSPNSSAHPFSSHTGFMALLVVAYNTRNQQEFVRVLEEYLQHAVLHVSQAGRREEIPDTMKQIRALIEHKEVGFEALARYILPVVNAPI